MESQGTANVTLSVRPSRKEDCAYIAENLREADRNEVQAVCGACNLEALWKAWDQTETPYTIIAGETPAGLFGVVPVEPGVGAIWLLGTDALVQGRWTFLRESKNWLNKVAENYDLLFNYVDERNAVHIKWIGWLGFTFINRHLRHGVEQRPFLEFVRIF